MRTSIAIGTFLIVGAGATGAGAVLSDMRGSDTMLELTRSLIAQCTAVGSNIAYSGTGSDNGRDWMGACQNPTTQQPGCQMIAPMSKAISVCAGQNGTSNTFDPSNENGIVVALDGVAVIANRTAGGSDACVGDASSCSLDTGHGLNVGSHPPTGGTAGVTVECPAFGTGYTLPSAFQNGDNTNTSWNEAYSAFTYTFYDWKEPLSILFAGMDHNATTASGDAAKYAARDCFSPIRRCLADNYGKAFATPTDCAGSSCKAISHLYRRDDSSGTTDVFRNLLGIPQPNVKLYSTPFCNALVHANPTSSLPTDGTGYDVLGDKQEIAPSCRTNDGNQSACVAQTGCAWDAVRSICLGNRIPLTQYPTTGTPTDVRPAINVFEPDMQDLDPIRRKAGTNEQIASAANEFGPGGSLGLVLVVTPVDKLYTGGTVADPSTGRGTTYADGATESFPADTSIQNKFDLKPWGTTKALNVKVTTAPVNTCPNGDIARSTIAQNCWWPYFQNSSGTRFRAINTYDSHPTVYNNYAAKAMYGTSLDLETSTYSSKATWRPLTSDNRAWNGFLRQSTRNHASFWQNASGMNITGGMYRLHTTVPTGTTCLNGDATTQIGCFVQNNPCSMAYAGREAVSRFPTTNAGVKVAGRPPAIECIRNLKLNAANAYAFARPLYLNTLEGFSTLEKRSSAATACATFQAQGICETMGCTWSGGTCTGTATNTAGLADWAAQLSLAKCYSNPAETANSTKGALPAYAANEYPVESSTVENGMLDELVAHWGFVPVPYAHEMSCGAITSSAGCTASGCSWNGTACTGTSRGVSSPYCADFNESTCSGSPANNNNCSTAQTKVGITW